jgi:creatinine amidohydrolase
LLDDAVGVPPAGRSRLAFGDCTAAELRALAGGDAVAIVPVASTEQHGPHLPVQVDTLLCGEIARRAGALLGEGKAVVLPAVWTGLAEHHMPFGGTVTLDFPTFAALLRCVVDSLRRHGFRRILLLNGHGGNRAALQVLVAELTVAFRLPIAAATYWEVAATRFAAILEKQATVQHACEAETSMMLALRPDLVDMRRLGQDDGAEEAAAAAEGPGLHVWRSFAVRTASGVIGAARAATAEKGERLIAAAAAELAAALAEDRLWAPRF